MGCRPEIGYDRAAAFPGAVPKEEAFMKKLFLFAAVAGLGLVSAGPPGKDEPSESRAGYPPCSRNVTDHCIQLHERGVRTPENLARNRQTQREDVADREEHCAGATEHRCSRHHRHHRQLAQRIRRAGERG
jgi:hypothetical protein